MAKRTKSAPILSWIVDPRGSDPGAGGAEGDRRAKAELAALLAVARAATDAEPSLCWGYDMETKQCRCQLHRALARLDRVSREGR